MKTSFQTLEQATKISDINWENWQGKHSATLMFIIQQERILLIHKKRGFGAGKINGPGGKQEPGESLHDCAIRETQEELCITPINADYAGENLFQFTDGYSIHVHTFLASDFTGSPTETDEAIPIWFPLNGIPYDKMWEDDKYWLPMVLKGENVYGRYLFNGDTMLDYELNAVGKNKLIT